MTAGVVFRYGRAGLICSDGSAWILTELDAADGSALEFRGLGERRVFEPAPASWRDLCAAELETYLVHSTRLSSEVCFPS